jgi:hypothetical protein
MISDIQIDKSVSINFPPTFLKMVFQVIKRNKTSKSSIKRLEFVPSRVLDGKDVMNHVLSDRPSWLASLLMQYGKSPCQAFAITKLPPRKVKICSIAKGAKHWFIGQFSILPAKVIRVITNVPAHPKNQSR